MNPSVASLTKYVNVNLAEIKNCTDISAICSLAGAEETVARNLQDLKSIYFGKNESSSPSISSIGSLLHNPLKSFYCDMPINSDTNLGY